MLKREYAPSGRVSLPIQNPEAHVTYWIAALACEQPKYRYVFNAARREILMNTGEKNTGG